MVYWYYQKKYNISEEREPKQPQQKFFSSLSKQLPAFMSVSLLVLMAGIFYFFFFTYMLTYYMNHMHISASVAFLMNCVILILACALYPVFGKLADRINNHRLFLISWLIILFLTIPFIYSLVFGNLCLILLLMFFLSIGMCGMQAVYQSSVAYSF